MTLLVGIIIGVAFAIHMAFGFGGALLALPLLTQILGIRDSVTLILVFQTLIGFQIFWIYKDIPFSKLKFFIPVILVGVVGGVVFLSRVNASVMEILLGLYLIAYVAIEFAQKRLKPVAFSLPSPVFQGVTGFAGGIISGAFGTGGPLIISYLKKLKLGKERLRATILFILFLANLIRIGLTAHLDMVNFTVTHNVIYAMPFFLLGIWGGYRLMKTMDEKLFHTAIDILLFLSGAALLLKHL